MQKGWDYKKMINKRKYKSNNLPIHKACLSSAYTYTQNTQSELVY